MIVCYINNHPTQGTILAVVLLSVSSQKMRHSRVRLLAVLSMPMSHGNQQDKDNHLPPPVHKVQAI